MGLTYTGLPGELEHLKIETRLKGESVECVMGGKMDRWGSYPPDWVQ
jgi:hypothetical protein